MSLDCKRGIEEKCPYLKNCTSDETDDIRIINSQIPYQIYSMSKNWTDTTKTWVNGRIYSCQPRNSRKARNIDLTENENFYGRDAKELRKEILEEVQNAIKKLERR